MRLRIAISILLLNFSVELYSQDDALKAIDSIKSILPSKNGKEKVNSLNGLAWYYRNSGIDSALYFSNQAYFYAKK